VGGNWDNPAGARCANANNKAWNVNENVGLRCVSDTSEIYPTTSDHGPCCRFIKKNDESGPLFHLVKPRKPLYARAASTDQIPNVALAFYYAENT